MIGEGTYLFSRLAALLQGASEISLGQRSRGEDSKNVFWALPIPPIPRQTLLLEGGPESGPDGVWQTGTKDDSPGCMDVYGGICSP